MIKHRHIPNIVSTSSEQGAYIDCLAELQRSRGRRELVKDILACIGFVALVSACLWWLGGVV